MSVTEEVQRIVVVRPEPPRITVTRPEAPRVTVVGLVALRGPMGPAGDPTARVVHEQTEPSATWLIPHPFRGTPTVTMTREGVREYPDVSYPSDDLVVLTFPMPTTGRAEIR